MLLIFLDVCTADLGIFWSNSNGVNVSGDPSMYLQSK